MKLKIVRRFDLQALEGKYFSAALSIVSEREGEDDFCPFAQNAPAIEPICCPEFGARATSFSASLMEQVDQKVKELVDGLREPYSQWVASNDGIKDWVGETEIILVQFVPIDLGSLVDANA